MVGGRGRGKISYVTMVIMNLFLSYILVSYKTCVFAVVVVVGAIVYIVYIRQTPSRKKAKGYFDMKNGANC